MDQKKKKKGSAKKKTETSNLPTESADQIEKKRLDDLINKEEIKKSEFQQQKTKLNDFYNFEIKKLGDKRAELRNKERELQDLEEKHQVEIKIYKQRLKHLLLEHQNEIAMRKTEAEKALKMAQDDDREAELDIKEDRRYINIALKEIELSHEEYIRSLKREQDQNVTELRHQFERNANDLMKAWEARMKKTREQLDKQRKDEVKSIEDKKAVMIDKLITEHQKAFNDIKNYYNDITHNNLDLIKSLKEEVKELENEERKDQIKLHEKINENKKQSLPLKKMEQDLLNLKNEYVEYIKEKNEMKRIKSNLLLIENNEKKLLWEYEVLYQRLNNMKQERDSIKDILTTSIYDIKQKNSFKSLLLEKKIKALLHIQEEKEAQLNEVLNKANLDPTELNQVKGEIPDIVTNKNNQLKLYQNEVVRLNNLQSDFNNNVINIMREYGLHVEELGFVLPTSNTRNDNNEINV